MRHVFAALVALGAATGLAFAQDQQARPNTGWPCNGHPDPTYFRTAEATGGQVFMFHPSEVADSGVLMTASFSHRETLFRVAGSLEDGLREYAVPVDGAVESVVFSVSLQCLQIVEIARPSGAVLQASDEGTDYHQFEAGQVVVVQRPVPGTWTVRVSGHGLFFLVVQAKSPELALGSIQLVKEDAQSGRETLAPLVGPLRAGSRQRVTVPWTGDVRDVRARIVSAMFDDLGAIALGAAASARAAAPEAAGEDDAADRRVGEFVVPKVPFRLAISGTDASGQPFSRVHAPLIEVAGR